MKIDIALDWTSERLSILKLKLAPHEPEAMKLTRKWAYQNPVLRLDGHVIPVRVRFLDCSFALFAGRGEKSFWTHAVNDTYTQEHLRFQFAQRRVSMYYIHNRYVNITRLIIMIVRIF